MPSKQGVKLMLNFERLKAKIKQNKILQYLIICAVSILIILLLSIIFKSNSEEIDNTTTLEKSLEVALEKIDGIDDVSVLIGYSNSEKVIAYTTITEEINDKIVTTKTPYLINGEVVVLKEPSKQINGVIIVVDGETDVLTKIKIQNVTTAFLDVGANIVEIIGTK